MSADQCANCSHVLDDHIPKFGCGKVLKEPVKFAQSYTYVCPCEGFK